MAKEKDDNNNDKVSKDGKLDKDDEVDNDHNNDDKVKRTTRWLEMRNGQGLQGGNISENELPAKFVVYTVGPVFP